MTLELLGDWQRVDYERALRRVLSLDFGDVPEDVFRRNVRSVEGRNGEAFAFFEDWSSGEMYRMRVMFTQDRTQVLVTTDSNSLD